MEKKDLKVGYVVETRNGGLYMVMPDDTGDIALTSEEGRISLDRYENDLSYMSFNVSNDIGKTAFDIIAVYGYSKGGKYVGISMNDRPLYWKRDDAENTAEVVPIVINDFAKEVYKNAVEHGFYENRSFGDMIALCHSELSEALEEYRKDKPLCYYIAGEAEVNYYTEKDKNGELYKYSGQKLEGIATEMIDCMLRILDWCGSEEIDIEELLRAKHEFNKTRPYKHGGKRM